MVLTNQDIVIVLLGGVFIGGYIVNRIMNWWRIRKIKESQRLLEYSKRIARTYILQPGTHIQNNDTSNRDSASNSTEVIPLLLLFSIVVFSILYFQNNVKEQSDIEPHVRNTMRDDPPQEEGLLVVEDFDANVTTEENWALDQVDDALINSNFYFIQLGSFSTRSRAVVFNGEFVQQYGESGQIVKSPLDNTFKVVIGYFRDYRSALEYKDVLQIERDAFIRKTGELKTG